MPPLSFSMFTFVFRLVSIVTFNFYSLLTLSLLGFRKFLSKTKTKILYFIVRFFHFHLKFVSNSAWLDSCLCMYFFFFIAADATFFIWFFSYLVFFFFFLCCFISFVYFSCTLALHTFLILIVALAPASITHLNRAASSIMAPLSSVFIHLHL